MNFSNIQTFLSVARYGSISAAASILYISQPAVSARLQQLEEALGVTLIERKKGTKSVSLTAQGKAFIPLAERWVTLYEETSGFAQQQQLTPLRVVCSLGWSLYPLQDLFQQLTLPECALALRILSRRSKEAFSTIQNRDADIGFAGYVFHSDHVICQPLFSEKMVLICSESIDLPEGDLHLADLDPRQEIFIRWGQECQIWHDSIWSFSSPPAVHVDSAALLIPFLEQGKYWCLCPSYAAAQFQKQGVRMQQRTVAEQLPSRTCYLLTPKEPSQSATAAIPLFKEKLLEHLLTLEKTNDGIHVLYSP